MNKTCLAFAAIGLIVFALFSSAQSARQTQPFRVAAQPVVTGKSLKVKLSVTNVSRQNQVFWVASGYCTNKRWKTDDPNISIVDYSVEARKTCMIACEHKVTLRPGETFDRVVSPRMNPNTRPGRRVIRFVNLQPNRALTDGSRLLSSVRYEPRAYWSRPITITLRRQWLGT